MSQSDVLKYLQKCKKQKTRKEIDEAIKVKSSDSLKRLREHGGVFFKIIKKDGRTYYVYWSKSMTNH